MADSNIASTPVDATSLDYNLTPPAALDLLPAVAAAETPAKAVPIVAPVATHATSTIDALVNASRPVVAPSAGAAISLDGRVARHNTNDMRFDAETGQVQVLGAAASPSERVGDDPSVDPYAEIESLEKQLAGIQAQLDEVRYDPRTGAKSLVNAEGSREQTALKLQLASLRNAHGYAQLRGARVVEQRRLDREALTRTNAEEMQRLQFAGGSQERAEALAAALLEEEARIAARAIVEARRGR